MIDLWRYAGWDGRLLLVSAVGMLVGTGGWLAISGRLGALAVLTVSLGAAELCVRALAVQASDHFGLLAVDRAPHITPAQLDRFYEHGFDPELGWIRKPNSAKNDLGRYPYTIDARGSRSNPGHERLPLLVATYGDSYTFCREVEDHETWPWYLAERLQANVLNFGVGNYGLDQALLRLEREYPENATPIVVMGVVPSTLARILSVWKHYNEFGNLFAFKPRFILDGGILQLVPNKIDTREKFFDLERYLPEIQRFDHFYESRFKREAFRSPYVVSCLVQWRTLALIAAKTARRLTRGQPRLKAMLSTLIADHLDRGGVWQTAELYGEDEATELLERLVEEYVAQSRRLGFQPVLVLLPMREDLEYIARHGHFYAQTLARIRHCLTVVDAAPRLLAEPAQRLYRQWHYSPAGNRIVAGLIAETLATLEPRLSCSSDGTNGESGLDSAAPCANPANG